MNISDNELYLVLKAIHEYKDPIGSGKLVEKLKGKYDASISTMGRILEAIDELGYVEKDGFKGRVITSMGKERLSQLEILKETNIVQKDIIKLINKTGKKGMLNYLKARKAIELEAVKYAIEMATEEDILRLSALLEKEVLFLQKQNFNTISKETLHEQGELDYKFHHSIILASKNPYFEAFYKLLETSGKTQEIYFIIASQSIEDHIYIYENIKDKNVEGAVNSLRDHLDNVITNCELYWKNRELVENYLKNHHN